MKMHSMRNYMDAASLSTAYLADESTRRAAGKKPKWVEEYERMQNQSLNQISMTLPVANNGVKYKQLSKCSIIVPDQNINKQK